MITELELVDEIIRLHDDQNDYWATKPVEAKLQSIDKWVRLFMRYKDPSAQTLHEELAEKDKTFRRSFDPATLGKAVDMIRTKREQTDMFDILDINNGD